MPFLVEQDGEASSQQLFLVVPLLFEITQHIYSVLRHPLVFLHDWQNKP